MYSRSVDWRDRRSTNNHHPRYRQHQQLFTEPFASLHSEWFEAQVLCVCEGVMGVGEGGGVVVVRKRAR